MSLPVRAECPACPALFGGDTGMTVYGNPLAQMFEEARRELMPRPVAPRLVSASIARIP